MTRGVVTVTPSASLLDVIKLMYEKNISGIAVVGENREYYFISHSDIISFIYNNSNHGDLSKINIRGVMRGPLDTIYPNTSIDDIIHMMQNQGLKRILISNYEKTELLGIITTHDVMVWNSSVLKRSIPILLLVIENDTSLLLATHVFKEEINVDLLDLFSGSLSAVDSILKEVVSEKGSLKTIQKDFYTILLEQRELVTAVLIVDHASIDIRRRLQDFVRDFIKTYKTALENRRFYSGSVNHFKLEPFLDKFKYLKKY